MTRGPDSNVELIDIRSDDIYISGNSVGATYEANVSAVNTPNRHCPSIDRLPLSEVASAISATVGAGATIAQGRDETDQRLLSEANSGGGQITDCVNKGQSVNSALSKNNNCAKSVTYSGLQKVSNNPKIDQNQIDGVPNAWKRSSGGAALHGDNYDTHKFDSNGDGYTDFEDWVFQVFGR